MYMLFNHNIMHNDHSSYQEEDVFKMMVKCHALNKCSTLEVYYISLPPSDIHCNLVMPALITLSKQISDAKLASNRPHPMDLCAQFVKNLARKITKDSVFLTPNMIHYGEEPDDEVFITAEAAQKGVVIENTGNEPLVGLRLFGPDTHKAVPAIGDYKKCCCCGCK